MRYPSHGTAGDRRARPDLRADTGGLGCTYAPPPSRALPCGLVRPPRVTNYLSYPTPQPSVAQDGERMEPCLLYSGRNLPQHAVVLRIAMRTIVSFNESGVPTTARLEFRLSLAMTAVCPASWQYPLFFGILAIAADFPASWQ